MKAKDELNALLLLAKNYERIKEIDVVAQQDRDLIDCIYIRSVPKSMTNFFLNRFRKIVEEEVEKAAALMEQAALKYAEAATK